jgi:TolB-like protein/Flp pilus assembly protein TadD
MAPLRVKSLLAEARRRRFFGTLALYIVGAWGALQVADLLFPGWGVPASAIRFVWIGAVLALPLAVVFGWRYDITAQGLRRTPRRDGDMHQDLGRADFVVLAALAVVLAGLVAAVTAQVLAARGDEQAYAAAGDIPPNSVAVLPFVNMSSDDENEYFSDGITEQLLNELSRVPGLHVAARTSSFFFKDRNVPMQEIGMALGVSTLLEGSVRKAGNTVRITAQLINASNGYHLWSETFDRELDDVLDIQDEIAREITDALRVERFVAGADRATRGGTDNAEAYDLYLRGLAYLRARTPEAVDRSARYFQEALNLDPDFPLALDGLAYDYLLKRYDGSMTADDTLSLALPLVQKALQLEPDLEQAHATLGMLRSLQGDFKAANRHFRSALEINPNFFQGHVNYGLSLVHQARLKDAAAAYLRALALDPLNANLNFNLGALMMLLGQFEDGREFLDKSISLQPDSLAVRAARTYWLAQYGWLAEAVRHGKQTYEAHPEFTPNIAALTRAYSLLRLEDQALKMLQALDALQSNDLQSRIARWDFFRGNGDVDLFIDDAVAEFRRLDARPGDTLNIEQAITVQQYAHALLFQQRNEEAVEHLLWAMGGEEGLARITYDQMRVLKLLALAYRRLGQDARADSLLERCRYLVNRARDSGWATPVLHVRFAEVQLASGLSDQAIEQLSVAVDKGFRDVGWLENGIFWQGAQDDPRLDRIKVRIIGLLETERAKLDGAADRA